MSAASAMVREEGVVRGLMRGVGVNTLRGFLGPGSQVTSYSLLKEKAVAATVSWRSDRPSASPGKGGGGGALDVSIHVACSLVSAAISVACVNPVRNYLPTFLPGHHCYPKKNKKRTRTPDRQLGSPSFLFFRFLHHVFLISHNDSR